MLDKNDLLAIAELIDNKLQPLKDGFDNLEGRFDNLENRFDNLENRFDNLEKKVDNLESRFDNLENEVGNLKIKVDNLENQVKFNTITVENAVNKCIQVMGEGYHLNAERFDRLDIDAVKNKADIAFSMSQLANEKIDRLIEKLNKSA